MHRIWSSICMLMQTDGVMENVELLTKGALDSTAYQSSCNEYEHFQYFWKVSWNLTWLLLWFLYTEIEIYSSLITINCIMRHHALFNYNGTACLKIRHQMRALVFPLCALLDRKGQILFVVNRDIGVTTILNRAEFQYESCTTNLVSVPNKKHLNTLFHSKVKKQHHYKTECLVLLHLKWVGPSVQTLFVLTQ